MQDHQVRPEFQFELNDDQVVLLSRLRKLPSRERAVIALRFGLDGQIPLTLKETGTRLGFTREGIRKIELRAVRYLGGLRNSH